MQGNHLLASAILLLLAPEPGVARKVTLPSSDFSCISKNRKIYLGQGSDPLLLAAKTCPALLTGASGLARSATQSIIDQNPASTLFVVSKSELKCLLAAYTRLQAKGNIPKIVNLDTDTCSAK